MQNGDASGDQPEDDEPANTIGPRDHFTKNNPRTLYIRVPFGPNGQTEKKYYKNPVDWKNSGSVHHLNRWRAQAERRANEKWGIFNLKRDAVIPFSIQETMWLANELKGDLDEMSYTSIMRDLLPRFQAKFPVPHRTGASLSSHISRNVETRKTWGRMSRLGRKRGARIPRVDFARANGTMKMR